MMCKTASLKSTKTNYVPELYLVVGKIEPCYQAKMRLPLRPRKSPKGCSEGVPRIRRQ
jgi:hypothetical protein